MSNKLRAVIYDKSTWIVIKEYKDESRHDLLITNKAMNKSRGWSTLFVNACDTASANWTDDYCAKFCTDYNIEWEGE